MKLANQTIPNVTMKAMLATKEQKLCVVFCTGIGTAIVIAALLFIGHAYVVKSVGNRVDAYI
jgi:hypothetical protein